MQTPVLSKATAAASPISQEDTIVDNRIDTLVAKLLNIEAVFVSTMTVGLRRYLEPLTPTPSHHYTGHQTLQQSTISSIFQNIHEVINNKPVYFLYQLLI